MPVQVVNRFALFRDEDVNSSEPNQSPQYDNTFANQAAENDTDTPWQEIKRGGTVQKASKKFVPFNENLKPPQPIRYRQKQTRDISGSTASNVYEKPYEKPSDKPYDYHENYCGACNLNFGSKSSILAHIKQNPQVHENFCNLCKRVFKDRNGLQNHVDNSFGHEIFCNLCLSAFKDSWGLQNHFENNYSVGHQFICLTCLLGFKSKTELERHLHTGELHVWCNTCDRKFRNQDERDNHWLHTAKHKHCLQPACEFDAPTAAELEKHLAQDHFQCEGCKKIFPSQNKLSLHCQTCKFEIPCPDCGERCAGQLKLAMHQDTCFSCTECAFSTNTEEKYKMHLVTKHSSPNTYIPCWACKLPLSSPYHLTSHLETCPAIPPTLLLSILGKWWYSPLYMDIDMHAQIRRNDINLDEMASWVKQGVLHPFVCRADSCNRREIVFSKLSGLVKHVQAEECAWEVGMLGLERLKGEFDRAWTRKDSVAGGIVGV